MKRKCAAALAIALALTGGADAQTPWKDSPEVKTLYEAARREGKVIVWGTQRREVEWIPAAFGAMYTQ